MEDRFVTTGAIIEEAELFHGYLVVLATFALNFAALGTYFSAAVYLLPLQATFPDEGRGRIACLPSTYLSIALFASLPAGWLQDKLQQRNVSIRYVFMVGASCLGLGPTLSSYGPTLNAILAGAAITGCGIGLTGFIAAGICVQWFQANRGTMLLLAMAGQGCGNFTYCNIVQWLIHEYFDGNWRMAMRLTALVSMTIALVSSTVMRLPKAREVEDYEAAMGWQTPCAMDDDLDQSLASLPWKNSIEDNILEGDDEDADDDSDENMNGEVIEKSNPINDATILRMSGKTTEYTEIDPTKTKNDRDISNDDKKMPQPTHYGSVISESLKQTTTSPPHHRISVDYSASFESLRSCASHITSKSDVRSIRTLNQSLMIASQSNSKSRLLQNAQMARNELQFESSSHDGRRHSEIGTQNSQASTDNGTKNAHTHHLLKGAAHGHNNVNRYSIENHHQRDETSTMDLGNASVNTGMQGLGQTLQRQATIMSEFEALSSLPVNYPQIIFDTTSRRHHHDGTDDIIDEESVSILSYGNQSFLTQDQHKSIQHTSRDCYDLEEVIQTRTVYCLLAWSLISSFAFTNFFVHVPAYAASVGLSTNVGSHALSKTGLCMLLGNVTLGGITDRIGSIRSLQITMMGLVFCQLIWPHCKTASSLNILAGLYGYMCTTQASVPLVILADAFGTVAPQAILTLVGLQNVCKFPGYFLGPMMVGQAYELFGQSYSVAAWMTAVFMFLGNISLFLIPSAAYQVETLNARYKRIENA